MTLSYAMMRDTDTTGPEYIPVISIVGTYVLKIVRTCSPNEKI